MRKQRKDEHIERLLVSDYQGNNLLSDVYVEPNSLPGLSLDDLDTTTLFLDKKVEFPLFINAMTGGTDMTEEINEDLAILAKEFALPMEVGSQTIALEDETSRSSFEVVRRHLDRSHIVISNMGAQATPEMARRAMDMIGAEAIGIHINVSQELAMDEGDRDFRPFEDNIRTLCQELPGKVLVKEIGFGMTADVGKRLEACGVRAIDVSGAGGTNFVEIEDLRGFNDDFTEFYTWGIPTARAILNVRRACPDIYLISSGGIRTASDILKSLIIGADICGISGELLRYLLIGGRDYAREYLDQLIRHTRHGMLLLGCRTIEELKKVPFKLVGRLGELDRADWQQGRRER